MTKTSLFVCILFFSSLGRTASLTGVIQNGTASLCYKILQIKPEWALPLQKVSSTATNSTLAQTVENEFRIFINPSTSKEVREQAFAEITNFPAMTRGVYSLQNLREFFVQNVARVPDSTTMEDKVVQWFIENGTRETQLQLLYIVSDIRDLVMVVSLQTAQRALLELGIRFGLSIDDARYFDSLGYLDKRILAEKLSPNIYKEKMTQGLAFEQYFYGAQQALSVSRSEIASNDYSALDKFVLDQIDLRVILSPHHRSFSTVAGIRSPETFKHPLVQRLSDLIEDRLGHALLYRWDGPGSVKFSSSQAALVFLKKFQRVLTSSMMN